MNAQSRSLAEPLKLALGDGAGGISGSESHGGGAIDTALPVAACPQRRRVLFAISARRLAAEPTTVTSSCAHRPSPEAHRTALLGKEGDTLDQTSELVLMTNGRQRRRSGHRVCSLLCCQLLRRFGSGVFPAPLQPYDMAEKLSVSKLMEIAGQQTAEAKGAREAGEWDGKERFR
jgi:hypothetical protein